MNAVRSRHGSQNRNPVLSHTNKLFRDYTSYDDVVKDASGAVTKAKNVPLWPTTTQDKEKIPTRHQVAELCNAVVNDRPDVLDHCEFVFEILLCSRMSYFPKQHVTHFL